MQNIEQVQKTHYRN